MPSFEDRGRYMGVILLLTSLLVSSCRPGDAGGEGAEARAGGELSRFAVDASLSGRVVENNTGCTVDATCYLRIAFADTSIAALYGTGEVAEPPCTIERAVSNEAFRIGRLGAGTGRANGRRPMSCTVRAGRGAVNPESTAFIIDRSGLGVK